MKKTFPKIKKILTLLLLILIISSPYFSFIVAPRAASAFSITENIQGALGGIVNNTTGVAGEALDDTLKCIVDEIQKSVISFAKEKIATLFDRIDLPDVVPNVNPGLVVPVQDAKTQARLDSIETEIKTVQDLTGNIVDKEYIIDCLFWAGAKVVRENVSKDVLGWMNTGNNAFFNRLTINGDPLNESFYIEDPSDFFSTLKKEIGKEFTTQLKLITPEKLPYASHLADKIERGNLDDRTFIEVAEITVDPAFYNDFYKGGWAQFEKYYSNPFNNPFLGELIAKKSLEESVSSILREQEKLLDYGDGVFPETRPKAGGTKFDSKIVTPSQVLKDIISEYVLGPSKDLLEGDEINEIPDEEDFRKFMDDFTTSLGSLKESYGL